ncbi:MAG TPA: hypothetical protein PLU50_12265, partial [Pseudobdellovibrionaceae bacterium]|nr:hypothetical protein [Pseudobdellovibrionaceae bacterium]
MKMVFFLQLSLAMLFMCLSNLFKSNRLQPVESQSVKGTHFGYAVLLFYIIFTGFSAEAVEKSFCDRVLSLVGMKHESQKIGLKSPEGNRQLKSPKSVSRDLKDYVHQIVPDELLDKSLAESKEIPYPFLLSGKFRDVNDHEFFIIRPHKPQAGRALSAMEVFVMRFRGYPNRFFDFFPGYARALGMERVTNQSGVVIEYRIPTAPTQNIYIKKLNEILPEEMQIGVSFYTPKESMVPDTVYLKKFLYHGGLPITETFGSMSGAKNADEIMHDLFVHRISLIYPKAFIDHLRWIARLFYWLQLDVMAHPNDSFAKLKNEVIGESSRTESSLVGNLDAALAYTT